LWSDDACWLHTAAWQFASVLCCVCCLSRPNLLCYSWLLPARGRPCRRSCNPAPRDASAEDAPSDSLPGRRVPQHGCTALTLLVSSRHSNAPAAAAAAAAAGVAGACLCTEAMITSLVLSARSARVAACACRPVCRHRFAAMPHRRTGPGACTARPVRCCTCKHAD